MEKIKIIAIISGHNGGFAYVLNRDIDYTYTKIDEDTIIGEDEGVIKFYERDNRTYPFGKTAFGGREFTLKLSDGTEEKCHGQWWDGMSKTARELYSYDNLVDFLRRLLMIYRNIIFFTDVTAIRNGLRN